MPKRRDADTVCLVPIVPPSRNHNTPYYGVRKLPCGELTMDGGWRRWRRLAIFDSRQTRRDGFDDVIFNRPTCSLGLRYRWVRRKDLEHMCKNVKAELRTTTQFGVVERLLNVQLIFRNITTYKKYVRTTQWDILEWRILPSLFDVEDAQEKAVTNKSEVQCRQFWR